MNQPQSYVVTLTGQVYGGDAIGRLPDGRAGFVPFALPGETVRISIVEDKPRHALARLEEILVPGETRILPRCRHFATCGGCHYQMMPYASQLQSKTAILVDQLKRIGKLNDVPIAPIVPSPEPWHYRNYVQFQISQEGKLGFNKSRSNDITPIEECFLPESPLDEIWPLFTFDQDTGIQKVGLRIGSQQDVQITLEGNSDSIPELVVEELDASVVHISNDSQVVIAGSVYTWLTVRDRLFRVSAGTFFQVNTPVAELMVEAVLTELPQKRDLTILEVYCGAGLFSAFLASRVERLVAIEASFSACDDFMFNLDEFDNVELYEAPAEAVIPLLKIKPDLVLVDPPRNGLERTVLQGILSMGAPKIVYVSCDPATLARDARYLVDGGYVLSQVTPFDMFPQTYHIESVSTWKRQL